MHVEEGETPAWTGQRVGFCPSFKRELGFFLLLFFFFFFFFFFKRELFFFFFFFACFFCFLGHMEVLSLRAESKG